MTPIVPNLKFPGIVTEQQKAVWSRAANEKAARQKRMGGGGSGGGLYPSLRSLLPSFGGGSYSLGTFGGGSGGSYLDPKIANQLAADFKRAMDEGKKANEDRYAAGRGGTSDIDAAYGGYKGRYERGLGHVDRMERNLEGAGEQALKDINRQHADFAGRESQNLIDRGLIGSTLATTAARGVEEDRQSAVGRLNDQLRAQRMSVDNTRLATDAKLSGDTLQFITDREDTYPSMGEYADLMMKLGQRSGGGGGYGGGGGQMYAWDSNNQPTDRMQKIGGGSPWINAQQQRGSGYKSYGDLVG